MPCTASSLMTNAAAQGYYGLEQRSLLMSILYMLCSNVGSGSGSVGVVDPEGSVTANTGSTYFNTALNTYWVKASGTGNTGWVQIV